MIKILFYIFFSIICLSTIYIIYEYVHYNRFKNLVKRFEDFKMKKCEFVKEGYDEIKAVFKKDKEDDNER
jgi:hypothetical protein